MTEDKAQWKPKTEDERKEALERWHAHLKDDERNPNAKETFDELTKRAAQPVKPEPEKPAESDSYNEK